uniref:J domain-containing protein n=1 Tax=Kalanchoe fedtschenkoi TaxID=63787 RepID=A0A7N0UDJ1_KALFE
MARKGNPRKRTVGLRPALPDDKIQEKVSDLNILSQEVPSNVNETATPLTERVSNQEHVREHNKNKQKSGNLKKNEKLVRETVQASTESVVTDGNHMDGVESMSAFEASGLNEENGTSTATRNSFESERNNFWHFPNGLSRESVVEKFEFSKAEFARHFRTSVFPILKQAIEWLRKQKPLLDIVKSKASYSWCYIQRKFRIVFPVVLRLFMYVGNFVLLLSMLWFGCMLSGTNSFLRMGTSAFITVLWCGIISALAMIGMIKFLIIVATAAILGVFVGVTVGLVVIGICATVCLWLYGSFWTTSLFLLCGGLSFAFRRESFALFITSMYSMYCAWAYSGWSGLLLGINLSFISSDALIYFLKNHVNEDQRHSKPTEYTYTMPNQQGGSETSFEHSADRGAGIPSTSGVDGEATSEDEVTRLLNCSDHYSALGFSKFGDVDVSVLKREYRKKAMLVHPDKNMGNEKAGEAFKKLQNAYEVLLDSLKRKEYDDELRRDELLNYFRKLQDDQLKNGRRGFFSSGYSKSNAEYEDPSAEARQIACQKCGNLHVWVQTKKTKSQARWCQDCQDFHPAKDGDGWVEQSSQPFLFGLMQKVDVPRAYVCADSKVYNATEWYICQGMRCAANTHKPSFHVNTSLNSKHSNKGGSSSGHRGGGVPPPSNENMTEEEFFEWLQNAVQAGVFDNFNSGTSAESPSGKGGSSSKSGGSSNSAAGNNKKKKKGKKW